MAKAAVNMLAKALSALVVILIFVAYDRFNNDLLRRLSLTSSQNILESPKYEDFDKELLVFNRVQKAGSSAMLRLFEHLARRNQFRFVSAHVSFRMNHSRQFDRRRINLDFVRRICAEKARVKRPHVFAQHHHFIDFPDYEMFSFCAGKPVYFNMVRDPFERWASKFNFSRRYTFRSSSKNNFYKYQLPQMEPNALDGKTYAEWSRMTWATCIQEGHRECNPKDGDIVDSQLAYFCGQGFECVQWNNPTALKRAKSNVERNFPIVPILEQLRNGLQVLEVQMPTFFRHAVKFHNQGLKAKPVNRGPTREKLPTQIVTMMKKRLWMEYDFFDYLKQRFSRQWKNYVIQVSKNTL